MESRIPAASGQCWPNDTAVYECNLEINTSPSANITDSQSPAGRFYRTSDCLVGQLTSKGFDQQLGNGKVLRQAYVDTGFLSANLSASEVWLRSDWEERTFMSAEAISLGMYPPDQSDEPQEFDIHVMDSEYDNLTPNGQLCPLWSDYIDQYYASDEFIKFAKTDLLPLLKQLSKQADYNFALTDLSHLHDCMNVHVCHNLSMPFTREQFYELDAAMDVGYFEAYRFPNRTANAQAGIGFLIKELYDWLLSAVQSKPTYQLLLYGAHDTTVMPILAAFDVWDGLWCPYATGIIFELYEYAESYAVRMIYNGHPMIIPGCGGELCDFGIFTQIVKQITPPENWQQFCATNPDQLGVKSRKVRRA